MSQTMILLNGDPEMDAKHKEVLAQIRDTYGNTTQILVSNEELCELAAVCAKFPRFSNPKDAQEELHDKAIDEIADVMIILDHVINIFGVSEDEVRARITGKVDRIQRWLAESDDQEQTLKDRTVNEQPKEPLVGKSPCDRVVPCRGCKHVGEYQQLKTGGRCSCCAQNGWGLFESKEGVGRGYRVNHQTDRKSGSKVSKEDFLLLLVRATKLGKEFPDEVVLHILPNHRGLRYLIDEYGVTWEAVWP